MPETETVLALAGLAVTAVIWAVERFLPGRKRIGYRVQMDTPIGMNPQDAHSLVQLRLLRQEQEISDATLALLRIENDGSKDIVRQDYQEPLTVEFTGRTVIGVEVPDANPTDLISMLTRPGAGLRYSGNRLHIPKVPLNTRNHFKLLVLLSGTDETPAGRGRTRAGGEVIVGGFLSGGRIRRNTQRWGPRKSSLALGGLFIVLVGLLGGLLLNTPAPPARAECATGRLTIDGSTAFAPPMQEIARQYQARCPGAVIDVARSGSLSGLANLNRAGRATRSGSPSFLAMSDVPAPSIYGRLQGERVGVILLSLVVNERTGVDNLTVDQVRKIYDGTYTNWRDVGGNDLAIHVVGRDAGSGTRRAFETTVLHRSEPGVVSSYDCTGKDRDERARVTRCEVNSTTGLLDAVDRVEGAVGYAETYAAAKRPHVIAIRLNGHEPDIEWGQQHEYPFWTVEFLYSYGHPADGSLAAKFLTYLNSDTAKNVMRMYKHVPCADDRSLSASVCRP